MCPQFPPKQRNIQQCRPMWHLLLKFSAKDSSITQCICHILLRVAYVWYVMCAD